MLLGFDIDGVLIDSRESFKKSWLSACNYLGIENAQTKRAVELIGHDLNFIQRQIVGTSTPEFGYRFRQTQMLEQNSDKVYPGVEALLGELSRLEIKIFLLSSRPIFRLHHAIGLLGLSESLALDLEALGLRPKPFPDGISYQMGANGVSSEQTFFIGDTVLDWKASSAAKVNFIRAGWGYGKSQDFERNVTTIYSPEALLTFIMEEATNGNT